MAQGVSCCHCRFFLKDKIGDGNGIGQCQQLEDYKAKGASEAALKRAFIQLGNKLFWGGDNGINDRYCEKYEQKTDL